MTIFRINSDSAWKDILDGFFQEFIEYCLPDLYDQIDWLKGFAALDKELHAITKDNLTGNQLVDKLFKVFLKNGEEQWVLMHIEVQGTPQKIFTRRMLTYNYRLFDKYQIPIISCAVLTDASKTWRPDYHEEDAYGTKLSIKYLLVKLIDYLGKETELEQSKNIFASVILTQLYALGAKKQSDAVRLNLKYNLTKRLYEKGFGKEKIKRLYLFLDWLINLPKPLEIKYLQSVYKLEEAKKMGYISNAERFGIEKGIIQGLQKGRQEGEVILLFRQIIHKFGILPNKYKKQIKQADSEALLLLSERVLDAKTLQEVFVEE